ncbi:hypothetical protein [Streptomyces sp. NPDC050264]|uniref:hypothetical protein n=1 Tax=Streptomyces sp. NPDC050264 TaxID=3155038 RepID=UPI00343E59E8
MRRSPQIPEAERGDARAGAQVGDDEAGAGAPGAADAAEVDGCPRDGGEPGRGEQALDRQVAVRAVGADRVQEPGPPRGTNRAAVAAMEAVCG